MANRINGFSVAGAVGFADGVDASIVTSSEQIIDSIFIPGGTFRSGDVILIQSCLIRSGTGTGNLTARIYWNETPDLTTPTSLGVSSGSANDEYVPIYRNICIVSNTSTIVTNTSSSLETDFGDVAGNEGGSAISTITSIDWNLDCYIIVAGQNATSTTITKKFLTIIK
jgi:hypothetical protein